MQNKANTLVAIIFSIIFFIAPCVEAQLLINSKIKHSPGHINSPNNLVSVENFLYQLENINLTSIGNSAFDLVIMDYSSDGEESGEFTGAQIEALKHSSGGEKIVVSYMSIGEAEDYRFYWNNNWSPGNPSWLGPENPDWGGNYKIKYWDSNWQNIVFQYTDRILSAGFDGVYLDIIDAYEFWQERGRTAAAQEMVDFIAAIAAHAKTVDPDFLIIPQNAPELASIIPSYLNYIDGIGQEDIYYGYDEDGAATPAEVTAELEIYLNVFKNAGKLVLTVDYPFGDSEDVPHFDAATVAKINDAYSRSSANGYVPYCTVRNLNYLTINPGHIPSAVLSKENEQFASGFELFQNYPNPFNSLTQINYQLPINADVSLVIYNMLGRKVRTLMNKNQMLGYNSIIWNGQNDYGGMVASGVYFYQIFMGETCSQTKKLMFLK